MTNDNGNLFKQILMSNEPFYGIAFIWSVSEDGLGVKVSVGNSLKFRKYFDVES